MLNKFYLYCLLFHGMGRCIVFQSAAKIQKLFDYQEYFLCFLDYSLHKDPKNTNQSPYSNKKSNKFFSIMNK